VEKSVKNNMYRLNGADLIIYIIHIAAAVVCLAPLLNIIAISFSESSAAVSGVVNFWPVRFTVASYAKIINEGTYLRSFGISIVRVITGTGLTMFLMVLMAYPLSKRENEFRQRKFFIWMLVITMLFYGGLVPTYLTVVSLGLKNSLLALILLSAVQAYNTILMMNFFRTIPKELSEAAEMDGAHEWYILFRIFLPISLPALATLGLFVIVYHWNEYFSGLIYMDSPENYPLQTLIYTLSIPINFEQLSAEEIVERAKIGTLTFNAAKIVISMIPVLSILLLLT
jgi:ABC-type glycerol-3-phosphate transport system permease component